MSRRCFHIWRKRFRVDRQWYCGHCLGKWFTWPKALGAMAAYEANDDRRE